MADVHALHEHVVVADDRLAAFVRAAVDDHVLTDHIVVADNHLAALSLKGKVLR